MTEPTPEERAAIDRVHAMVQGMVVKEREHLDSMIKSYQDSVSHMVRMGWLVMAIAIISVGFSFHRALHICVCQ